MDDKIRILFLAADPLDVGYRPRLGEEIREIGKEIRAGSNRDSFDLKSEWAVRPNDLQTVLLQHNPHIVHFSGHGSRSQGIILEDDDGNMHPVGKKVLADLFFLVGGNLRVVVLNACFTRIQGEVFQQVVDYTIGINKAIGDQAAVAFSAAFYRALAFGRSVQQAYELAKNQLDLLKIPESKKIELLIREGVDASKPFLI
jgi:CHAT domain